MKFEQNRFENLFKKIENKEYVELVPENYDDVYYLIHGFSSSLLDLMPMAKTLYELNHKVIIIILKGHNGIYEPNKMKLENWTSQTNSIIEKTIDSKNNNYLIGFSIGGLLALNLESKYKFKGLLLISTFLGHKKNSPLRRLLPIFKRLKIDDFNRSLRVSDKKIIDELAYLKKTSVNMWLELDIDAQKILNKLDNSATKLLFIHNKHDRVSSYKNVKKFIYSKTTNAKLITFNKRDHFIQFKIDSKEIINYFNDFVNDVYKIDLTVQDKIELQSDEFLGLIN